MRKKYDIRDRSTTNRSTVRPSAREYRRDRRALLAGYSRLLIDCNRPALALDLVPPVADGRPVPANQDL
ncbi:MAG: hypothetical protein QF437_22730, partial [Planctomycetota bacterium]|nr:hypothetical protein [Planctomycetota bacterium]